MKYFSIIVDSIDYAFMQNKEVIELPCDGVQILGVRTVSAFNARQELERKILFLVQHNQRVYGTESFKSLQQYLDYRDGICMPCANNECGIALNGCLLTLNGCTLN